MNEIQEFLKSQEQPRKKPVRRVIDKSWHPRYEAAHRLNQDRLYPSVVKDHGYVKTTFPDTTKANGLTNAIINFLMWHGYRATRISSEGKINYKGRKFKGKYVPGSTRNGTADISSTIRGMSVMWEVKAGKDRPSPEQLREQQLEQAAGGKYFFVHTFNEFLLLYDKL